MNLINKFVLGTAQIGLNYGIANKNGKPNKNDSISILQTAIKSGIKFFDTAYSYGNSELIIGQFLSKHNNKEKINIITKLPDMNNQIRKEIIINYFNSSLKRLKVENIYCYMVHNVNNLFTDKNKFIINTLREIKHKGKIDKIGVSVYSPEEVIKLLELGIDIDVVQIPFNLLDQRLLEKNFINKIKKRNIELHTRSIFLQGLLLMNSCDIPDKFNSIKNKIQLIDKIASKLNIDRKVFLLSFICSIKEIDNILVGVDSKKQLLENIKIFKVIDKEIEKISSIDFSEFAVDDRKILNPSLWSKL